MSKIQKFALTASIMLALALTISCSSDDGSDDVPIGGGLPVSYTQQAQVYSVQLVPFDEGYEYSVGEKFNGSANVVLRFGGLFGEFDYDGDPISAGEIQDGKMTLNLPSIVEDKYLVPYPKYNLSINNIILFAVIPDKGLCRLGLMDRKEDGTVFEAALIYSSGAVNDKDNPLSNGWNVFYSKISDDSKTSSTNSNIIEGNILKWVIEPEDDCQSL